MCICAAKCVKKFRYIIASGGNEWWYSDLGTPMNRQLLGNLFVRIYIYIYAFIHTIHTCICVYYMCKGIGLRIAINYYFENFQKNFISGQSNLIRSRSFPFWGGKKTKKNKKEQKLRFIQNIVNTLYTSR